MKKLSLIIVSLMVLTTYCFAQNDAEGCKDHDMLTRMPGYYIVDCSHSYNQIEIPTTVADGEPVWKTLEGNVTLIQYGSKDGTEGKLPSWFQVSKNYENALAKIGGKKTFGDGGNTTFHITGNNKDVWISLELITSDGEGVNLYSYRAKIIEITSMEQEIQATDIYEKLNTEGHIALYINFETGKSDIKAESQKVIDEISDMLKANASVKVSIEGHTDNAGNAASNKTLSEARGKAVMNAIIAKGIDKTRLSSKGWGQEKPIADNGTEEGKSKNRRVEIVKL